MDSGGRSGGGVPASAVRTLMRRGLGAGLTDEQVRAFLQPGFLRGISDPWGGARLLDFIGQQDDPAFLGQLAVYAGALDGREMSWMSAQSSVFDAFPLLRAAYMSQAAAIPPDLDTAAQMLSLANQGYRPAADDDPGVPGRGQPPVGGCPERRRRARRDVVHRLRLIRGELRRAALPGRGVGGRQPSRVPGVGPADRRVARRRLVAGRRAGPGGVPGAGHVNDVTSPTERAAAASC